ncbi:hypothetical protein ACFWN5_19595 [Streptomyces sp. NPDC058430]
MLWHGRAQERHFSRPRRRGGLISSGSNPHWALFDCGMAEFLRRLMTAEFDARPLNDLSLWGRVGTFVHHAEQERRFPAGLDPMTGEPDPYVGMFD